MTTTRVFGGTLHGEPLWAFIEPSVAERLQRMKRVHHMTDPQFAVQATKRWTRAFNAASIEETIHELEEGAKSQGIPVSP